MNPMPNPKEPAERISSPGEEDDVKDLHSKKRENGGKPMRNPIIDGPIPDEPFIDEDMPITAPQKPAEVDKPLNRGRGTSSPSEESDSLEVEPPSSLPDRARHDDDDDADARAREESEGGSHEAEE
jgi:hypothetical protein